MTASRNRFILCGLATALLAPLSALQAQEGTRPSMVASRLARKYSFSEQGYNLKLGPVTFDLSAGLQTEFNDNVNLSSIDPQSDVIITPSVNLRSFWPLTPFNALSLNTGVSYPFYLNNTRPTNSNLLSIAPDSELNFDVFLSHIRLNFHDRFSIQQDPVDQPSLSNVTTFGRFTNQAGVTANWDVNRLTSITLGYDHSNTLSTNSTFTLTDNTEDQLIFSVSRLIGRGISGGLESSITSTRYSSAERPDAISTHAGLFLDGALSEYTDMRVAGGYQRQDFAETAQEQIAVDPNDPSRYIFVPVENPSSNNGGNFYANLVISNRFRKNFRQSLSVGRETQLGVVSQLTDDIYARYSATWTINSKISLNGLLFIDKSSEQGPATSNDFVRSGFSLSTSYQFNRKLSGTLSYRFARKDADGSDQDYTQNAVTLGLAYKF